MQDNPDSTKGQPSRLEILKTFARDAKRFFEEELWDRDERSLPGLKRRLFASCRIASIVVKGFIADNCGLQASALTYISLMSMIPILAMMFSFSKGLGMQKYIFEAVGLERREVVEMINDEPTTRVEFAVCKPPAPAPKGESTDGMAVQGDGAAEKKVANGYGISNLPEPMQKAITTIFSYVENTRFGTLGLIGSLLLFWAVVKSMSKLERSFNTIWGIRTSRPLFRKFTEYFFVLTLIPVLFLAATSMNAMLSSPTIIRTLHDWVGPLAGLYQRLLRLFGVAVIAGAFTFLYKFMPNTRVKLFPATVAGCIGGLLWYGTQWAYITFQIGITRYNTIYGTFAAVPFFLAWLYVNWTIVLFGAEISFAVQNHRTYRLEGAAEMASPAARAMLGLVVTYETCRAYLLGQAPWCPSEWGREHAIPTRLLVAVTDTLSRAGILVAIAQEPDRDDRFLPGRSLEHLTLAHVEEAFRVNSGQYTRTFLSLVPAKAAVPFNAMYQHFVDDLSSVTFRDLLSD